MLAQKGLLAFERRSRGGGNPSVLELMLLLMLQAARPTWVPASAGTTF
ncbi:hypothetical protein [Acinetobacter baumannii]|nr:hypothetical protein [Acinetobacter baumannii]